MVSDPAMQFADAIRADGLSPPDVIEAGRFHRFPGEGKRNGNKAGWCKLFDDGRGGVYGDHSTGLDRTWQATRSGSWTPAERDAFRRNVEEAKAKALAKRREEQAEAARNAFVRWDAAKVANAQHPYLAAKVVRPYGIRQEGDLLLVPMRADGELHSLQTIAPDGEKRFLPGGRVAGCYHSIGKPDGAVCIAEGYATGATVHEATGHAVAVAFNAGNVPAVALALRAKFPGARIIVCADDDHRTAGNPGRTKATEAARAVGGLVAVPDFGGDRPDDATDFNDLARHRGAEAIKQAIRSARAPDVPEPQPEQPEATAGASWPDPQPLTVAEDARAYPIEALPSGIREAVAEVVSFVQCPPALAACSALSALSLSGQGLANVRRAAQLEGPISLYLLAVGDSGERKTTCDSHFLQPIREWEREQAERAKPDIARSAAAIAAWKERKAGIESRIRDASRKGKNGDAAERELADMEADAPRPCRFPRVIHSDATPEALAWSLANHWPSGGVMSSEAGIVFGGHSMGRDSVMRNLSLLNALWDGASHRVERRTSESFTLHGARLTMGLAAQPETIRQFMEGTNGLARGNGFAARFLIADPQSTQGTRRFREAPEWSAVPAFTSRLRALLDLPLPMDESGALALPMLTFAPDALAVWIAFYDDVEVELRPGGDMADARDVASKAADNVARMAALFHLYAHGPSGQIAADSVRAAAQVVGWHLYQARAFLGEVAAPRELSNARRLDRWLLDFCRREGLREIERRTIQNRGPNAVRGKVALDAALAELVEAGRLREADDGRRKLVRINPALLGGDNGPA